MENAEMGKAFEGEQPNVEKLQQDIAKWTESNQKYNQVIEAL